MTGYGFAKRRSESTAEQRIDEPATGIAFQCLVQVLQDFHANLSHTLEVRTAVRGRLASGPEHGNRATRDMEGAGEH